MELSKHYNKEITFTLYYDDITELINNYYRYDSISCAVDAFICDNSQDPRFEYAEDFTDEIEEELHNALIDDRITMCGLSAMNDWFINRDDFDDFNY